MLIARALQASSCGCLLSDSLVVVIIQDHLLLRHDHARRANVGRAEASALFFRIDGIEANIDVRLSRRQVLNVFIVSNGHHLVLHANHVLLQLEELDGESLQSGGKLAEGVNGLNLLEHLIDQLLRLAILSH